MIEIKPWHLITTCLLSILLSVSLTRLLMEYKSVLAEQLEKHPQVNPMLEFKGNNQFVFEIDIRVKQAGGTNVVQAFNYPGVSYIYLGMRGYGDK